VLIVQAILEAVDGAGPHGAPAGVMFAAMSAHGCSHSQFTSLMAGLQSAGALDYDPSTYCYTRARKAEVSDDIRAADIERELFALGYVVHLDYPGEGFTLTRRGTGEQIHEPEEEKARALTLELEQITAPE
jgi:hypothetical protein